jgi:hypothetical protein
MTIRNILATIFPAGGPLFHSRRQFQPNSLAAFLCFLLGHLSAGAQTLTVFQPVNHAESAKLTSLSSAAAPANARTFDATYRRTPQLKRGNNDANQAGLDPSVQLTQGQALNVTSLASFDGMRVPDGGSTSSTTSVAVGLNHIVQTMNGDYAIFSKSGVSLWGPYSLTAMWAALGAPCADGGDASVEYDQIADRWIFNQAAGGDRLVECVAVSKTGNPSDGYSLYAYAVGANRQRSSAMSVWPTPTNSAFLAVYEERKDGVAYGSAELCAYDRSAMLAGAGSPVALCMAEVQGAGLLPANLEGLLKPPDKTPGYFAGLRSTKGLGMYAMSMDFKDQSASVRRLGFLTVDSFQPAPPVPQPGTSAALDSTMSNGLTDQLAFRMFQDHASIIATHAVNVQGVSGVRWYELRSPASVSGSFTVFQEGTFAPADGYSRWGGNASTDGAGDIVLGYLASGTTLYPSARLTGRTPTDPLGMMESESNVREGFPTSSQVGPFSSAHIDPSDDCTFWTATGATGTDTWIAAFRFDACGAAAPNQLPTTVMTKAASAARSSVMSSAVPQPRTSAQKAGNGAPFKAGIFRSGFSWLLDVDGNRMWNDPPDRNPAFGGLAGDIPITGDWSGDGYTHIGIYRPGTGEFLLDLVGHETVNSALNEDYTFLSTLGGPQAGDIPVVGDWSGSGTTKVGIFRAGFEWILDYNGDGVFDAGDVVYEFGGEPGDVPVVGDWTGTGTSKIGVVRDGFLWLLDANGNGTYDGTAGGDYEFPFGGLLGDVPLVGDWTGDGVSKVGMFRDGFFWVLDTADPAVTASTGSAPLSAFAFGGIAEDVPVVGNWFSPPATITTTSGTPQSTAVGTDFSQPLAVTAIGYDGYPVYLAWIQFELSSGFGSSPGAEWLGLLEEGTVNPPICSTNGSGVATAACDAHLRADSVVGGPYFVTATAVYCGPGNLYAYPGCPATASATFSLTNAPASMNSPQVPH